MLHLLCSSRILTESDSATDARPTTTMMRAFGERPAAGVGNAFQITSPVIGTASLGRHRRRRRGTLFHPRRKMTKDARLAPCVRPEGGQHHLRRPLQGLRVVSDRYVQSARADSLIP
jgi:hypothetical protein